MINNNDNSQKILRSSEKARNSTCLFADLIASICIAKYETIREKNQLLNNQGNTVIAGILIEKSEPDTQPELIALASGTKHGSKFPGLKDLHAEVLVRRAYNRYMADQILKNPTENDLVHDLKVHYYISSAPCGNACIRRWANPKKENWVECTGLPEDNHPILHGFAIKEGQFALTVKKERLMADINEEESNEKYCLPAGILPYKSGPNLILSCSDKILIWNCVGLIKIPLINWLPQVFISSLTIGRKFARPHLSRAVCCRIANKFPNVKHPVLLCSSVKLDKGGLDVEEGARFDSQDFVFIWSKDRNVEILSSKTGFQYPDNDISCYNTKNILNDLSNVLPFDKFVMNELIELKKSIKNYLISIS